MKQFFLKHQRTFGVIVSVIIVVGVVVLFSAGITNSSESKRSLRNRIMLAGDYLQNAVNEDGSFVYEFDAKRGVAEDGYNILRHAGTIYAMFELHEQFPDDDLRTQGETAINYLIDQMQPCQPDALCVVEDDELKLGGNALAILALVQYSESTNTRDYDDTIQQLASWMMSLQKDSGRYSPHKFAYSSMTPEAFVSTYYPGEAIYALTRACQMLDEQSYCDSAASGADWLINVRDAELAVDELPHDHWLLYGLRELYHETKNHQYLTQSQKIAAAIINAQIINNPDHPEWTGGFYEPPRSAPTATRMEGLVAAYETAKNNDTQYKQAIRQSLNSGMKLLAVLQVTPELQSIPSFELDSRSIGGLIRGFGSQDIRIDYVQHALSAMLGYYRIL